MKPLVKWVIGPVSSSGFSCLKFSIRNFLELYKDRFEYVICYNNLNEREINFIKQFNVPLYNQEDFCKRVNWGVPFGCIWKLFVPKFGTSHEITLDNDLIIRKRLPQIEEFLDSQNKFLITEALKRNYGIFDNKVKSDIKYNTGLLGIPPNYDITAMVDKTLKQFKIEWKTWFDEQGLTSYLIQDEDVIFVPLRQINVKNLGMIGDHWATINATNKYHWKNKYRSNVNLLSWPKPSYL